MFPLSLFHKRLSHFLLFVSISQALGIISQVLGIKIQALGIKFQSLGDRTCIYKSSYSYAEKQPILYRKVKRFSLKFHLKVRGKIKFTEPCNRLIK